MSARNFDIQIKLLMIGDSGVGKTCLLVRYSNDTFSPTLHTIGIDFKIKNIVMDGKRIKLQIWDTAGQERFRTIATSYFRGAHGILLVYDVSDKTSFASIRNWVAQIEKHADVNCNKVLIGNKCDFDGAKRQIAKSDGENLAKEYDMLFFETSAKTGVNVEEAFLKITADVKDRLISEYGQYGDVPVNGKNGTQKVNARNSTSSSAGGSGRKCC